MKEINLTINGKQAKGKEGDTVLEVCRSNGIDVPALCHFQGLSNVGACRICVVEVERERRPVPACTHPAGDGMVVKTDTPALENHRRLILELMFTERNHFCMFCEVSGDCELQKLAYRYQMDHVRYTHKFPKLPVDALSEYLIIDHNRCILCGRCVRACQEVAASRTIGFSSRGHKTMVSADLEESLGESTCRLCGPCIESCPTGAIMNRLSLYKGTRENCTELQTACPGCAVGCELNVWIRDNNLVKIESTDMTGDLRGSLCRMGRFELLEPAPPRITTPLLRNKDGKLEACSLEEAAAAAAGKFSTGKAAGIFSSRLPGETAGLFKKFMEQAAGSELVDTTDGNWYRAIASGMKNANGNLFNAEIKLESIPEADFILLVGADPQKTNPVVSTLIRRTVNSNKAKLVVIDADTDLLPLWSYIWLKPKPGTEDAVIQGLMKGVVSQSGARRGLSETLDNKIKSIDLAKAAQQSGISQDDLLSVATAYAQAKKPVIIYGDGLLAGNTDAINDIVDLATITANGNGLGVLSLKPNANSRGAWELGLAKGVTEKPAGMFLLLGDEEPGERLLKQLKGLGYLVVQASYESPATEMADVVLPSPIWAERAGKYVAIDGHTLEAKRVLDPAGGMAQDAEVLTLIAKKLERSLV